MNFSANQILFSFRTREALHPLHVNEPDVVEFTAGVTDPAMQSKRVKLPVIAQNKPATLT